MVNLSAPNHSIRLRGPHHRFVYHHRMIVNVELMMLLLVWVRMGLNLVLGLGLPRNDRLRRVRGHMIEFRLAGVVINLTYLYRMVAHFLIGVAVLFKGSDTVHNFWSSEPGQEVACLDATDVHNGRVEFLASKKRVIRQVRVWAFGDHGKKKKVDAWVRQFEQNGKAEQNGKKGAAR
jgi:hypothetical protein